MRVVVVDDEELARKRLKRLLREFGTDVIAESGDGLSAIELTKKLEFDVLFIDINMPKMNGIEAAAQVKQSLSPRPLVVFCTAHDQYAINAFEVNASDYLLKPVTRADLQRVLLKCEQILTRDGSNDGLGSENKHFILVQISNELQKKNIEDFYSFQAIDKHIYANLVSGETTYVDVSLSQLEEQFPDQLLRVHRSSVVNVDHVSSLGRDDNGRYYVKTGDFDQPLYVSRRHLPRVKEALRR